MRLSQGGLDMYAAAGLQVIAPPYKKKIDSNEYGELGFLIQAMHLSNTVKLRIASCVTTLSELMGGDSIEGMPLVVPYENIGKIRSILVNGEHPIRPIPYNSISPSLVETHT